MSLAAPPADGLSELGRITHDQGIAAAFRGRMRRALVVGERLVTISDVGVASAGIDIPGSAAPVAFEGAPPDLPPTWWRD